MTEPTDYTPYRGQVDTQRLRQRIDRAAHNACDVVMDAGDLADLCLAMEERDKAVADRQRCSRAWRDKFQSMHERAMAAERQLAEATTRNRELSDTVSFLRGWAGAGNEGDSGLRQVAQRILDKLDHPEHAVTALDADALREALNQGQSPV